MDSKVARVQPDGVLRYQSVPPLLRAYNKYTCGVDVTGQLLKSYALDRKSKRYWLRLFFQFLNYAINNAYLLYKHSCKRYGVKPMDLLAFRLELVRLLLQTTVRRPRNLDVGSSSSSQSAKICYLKRVSEIGLSRGRCHQCLQMKIKPPHHTSFGCSVCRVRLCKTTCFRQFHNYL